MTVAPVRLDHSVLYVADLDRSLAFYTEVIGLELVERKAAMNAAFLRSPRSVAHHDLGLFGIGPVDTTPGRRVGLYHLAWQVDTVDELVEFRQRLVDAGAHVGESNHGAAKSLYGVDPDGIEFEIVWMLPRDAWGDYETSGVVEPLDLSAEVTRWSGIRTAGQFVQEPR